MVKRFQRYIEDEPWDRRLVETAERLNGAIRIFLLFAAVFFAWPVIRTLWAMWRS